MNSPIMDANKNSKRCHLRNLRPQTTRQVLIIDNVNTVERTSLIVLINLHYYASSLF